jgi:hypothetical protein
MGLPIHDAARRAIEHAGHVLAEDIQHAETDLSNLIHHRPYHHHDAPVTTPAPEAPPMSLTATLKQDAETARNDLKAAAERAEEFFSSKLPDALGDVEKLEGNPVAEALLTALHVPASAFQGVVEVIETLAKVFPKPDDTAAVSDAPSAPEPVAAGPVVAGQA